MRKMRLKKRKYIFKNKIILIAILIIISVIYVLRFIDKKASPILFNYAGLESKKIASILINDAISSNINDNIDIDELFIITRDNSNEIKTIDFNPITVNKILASITKSVQLDLNYLEKGNIEYLTIDKEQLNEYNEDDLKKGIICQIPSGVILGNSFLANLGPRIPVKFNLDGDIVSYINTNVTNYGINNAVIQINVVLEVAMQVILPFKSERIVINTPIPVAIKLIQGSVPNYYFNGINQNSHTLSLPIE